MDPKLKSLKVADLKAILVQAEAPAPAKATKADLVARILASQAAQEVYRQIYDPQAPQNDALDANGDANPGEDSGAENVAETPQAPVEQEELAPAEPAAVVDPELEAMRRRAARFGIPLVEKDTRPERTKGKPEAAAPATEEPSKLETRAERFGIKRPAPAESVDPEEAERRRKRAERFGILVA